jgi:tetratricopeptide (TPR) repeat protein
MKDYQSAVGDYKKAIEIDPDLFEAHLKLGDVLSRIGQNEAAIESYIAVFTGMRYIEMPITLISQGSYSTSSAQEPL